jgi:hypothetical protein
MQNLRSQRFIDMQTSYYGELCKIVLLYIFLIFLLFSLILLKSNSLFVSSGRSDGLLLSKYLPPFALFERMGYNTGGTFQVVGYGL